MQTVGYGDVYPLTVGGKLITALAMVVGEPPAACPACGFFRLYWTSLQF